VAITITTGDRDARAAVILDKIDVATPAAYIQLRDGTRPAGPATAATGTLLATITLPAPAFPAPHGSGVTSANGLPITVQGAATGDPTWFRLCNGDNVAVFDGTAGTSGTDAVLSAATITEGENVELTALTWTEPDGT
jgi:hypothetical protein